MYKMKKEIEILEAGHPQFVQAVLFQSSTLFFKNLPNNPYNLRQLNGANVSIEAPWQ